MTLMNYCSVAFLPAQEVLMHVRLKLLAKIGSQNICAVVLRRLPAMDHRPKKSTAQAEQIAKKNAQPLEFTDERLSSAEAKILQPWGLSTKRKNACVEKLT